MAEMTTPGDGASKVIVPLLVDHRTREWVRVDEAAGIARVSERTIRKNLHRFGRMHLGRWWIYLPALMASADAVVEREK